MGTPLTEKRRFRFAFLLVTPSGSQPSALDLAKLESYRQQFEAFFAAAASRNAAAETSLRRALKEFDQIAVFKKVEQTYRMLLEQKGVRSEKLTDRK